MKAIKVLILVLMSAGLFIALGVKAVYSTQPTRTEHSMPSAPEGAADDVAILGADVEGLAHQVHPTITDLTDLQTSSDARPLNPIAIDANGEQLGDVLLGNFAVGFETSVGLVGVWFNRAGSDLESSSLFFLDPDCQGQGYAEPYWVASGVPEAFVWQGQLLVVDQTQPTIDLGDFTNAWKAAGDGSCSAWDRSRRVYPTAPVAEIPDFQLPIRTTMR